MCEEFERTFKCSWLNECSTVFNENCTKMQVIKWRTVIWQCWRSSNMKKGEEKRRREKEMEKSLFLTLGIMKQQQSNNDNSGMVKRKCHRVNSNVSFLWNASLELSAVEKNSDHRLSEGETAYHNSQVHWPWWLWYDHKTSNAFRNCRRLNDWNSRRYSR